MGYRDEGHNNGMEQGQYNNNNNNNNNEQMGQEMNYMSNNNGSSIRSFSSRSDLGQGQQLYNADDVEQQQQQQQNDKVDKFRHERMAMNNDAQSVAYTAYTMNQETDIVQQLRGVGVTVLSLESLSTAAMINYMDAVATMRLGNGDDEKCMLYTDSMGRVFNVIISGGAEGLAKSWSATQAGFSGWLAITVIPFLVRNLVSYSFNGYIDSNGNNTMAFDPLFLLAVFGFILKNETSYCMLSMSLFVKGTNSVGSYVWRGGSLTDYPRLALLMTFSLASFASPDYPLRDILSLCGTLIGTILLLCNLGSRAWSKAEIGYIDASNVFTPTLTILASLLAGIVFPYVGLRFVDGGFDIEDGQTAVEKIVANPNGKRARQNVTAVASFVALVFLFSDIQMIQDSLGFRFSHYRGLTNIAIGGWWLLTTLASMSLCHHLDSSKSKKIEPFLRRDETSPVGWVVPSVAHIVIDPNLSKGGMILSFLSYGSDMLCSIIAAGLAFLIVWNGIKDFQGKENTAFWDWS